MLRPSKKIISIALATLAGAGIVLFAMSNSRFFNNKVSLKDTSGEVSDNWRDALDIVPQNTSDALTTTQRGLKTSDTASSSTLTTTESVAQAMLSNMLLYKASGQTSTMSDADAQAIAQSISKSTPDQNPVKHYTREDIVIVPTTTESFAAYQKELSTTLNTFAQKNTGNELLIVTQALDAKDSQKLIPLGPMIESYKKLIDGLLHIKTPEIMADVHLLMITGYAMVISGVEDMQQAFVDPARGIAGITKYQAGANVLIQVNTIFSKM